MPNAARSESPLLPVVPEPAMRPAGARVAYAVGDRVVQTLHVSALGSLRVGSSEENDLVLCDSRVGRTHTLLRREGTRWWLTLPAALHGRARVAGQAGSLHEHVAAGRARRRDEWVEIPLPFEGTEQRASAVVELERGRLLIAVEDAPAVHVAPLPRVLRRDLRGDVDWRFAGTLSAFLIGFFFLGLAAEAADPLADLTPPESVFAFRPIYDAPEPPAPDMPSEPSATEGDEAVVADAPPSVRRDGPRTDGPSSTRDDGPRLTREEATQQAALLIGSIGVGTALHDALAGGAAVANGHELLDAVTNGSLAATSSHGLVERTGRDGTDELGRLSPTAPTVATTEGPAVRERQVRVQVTRPTATSGAEMPMDQVTRAIRSRVAGIRRCYERTLGSNPSARGRVMVSFQVQGSGGFSNVSIEENATGDAELGACVSAIIGRLRVSEGPTGGPASFRYPFVFEPG